jgi:CheY-like chemotaxis protein
MRNAASPMRVLLVDDDGIFRHFVRQTLEEMSPVAVQEAGNGHEASRLLLSTTDGFDLIVCDVFMPDMDGLEFLDVLVSQCYRGKLTVVSGGDPTMLEIARTFAVQSGLRLTGAFPKEAVNASLLRAILDFA